MKLRRPKPNELNELMRIHSHLEQEFKFPDLSKLYTIYVVEKDNEIIGWGMLQPIYEAILVVDETKPLADRVEAVGMLQEIAESDLKSIGIKEVHAFVQKKVFGNFLSRRLGFKKTKGSAMVKVI